MLWLKISPLVDCVEESILVNIMKGTVSSLMMEKQEIGASGQPQIVVGEQTGKVRNVFSDEL